MIHQKRRTDPFVLTFAAACLFAAAPSLAEDLRTITVRVVPELQWQAAPTAVAISSENNADHAKAGDFLGHMDTWIAAAFEQLGYQVEKEADVRFHHTLEIYDPGSAAKRWAVGFGAGKSYVEGTVTVERQGEVVGRYRFSARPKTAGPKGLSKEVGPAVVLQIHNGEADEQLHEYKKKEKGR